MGNLRGWEWLILLAIVLLLFGARRLPDLARSVGKSMKIFRSEVKDLHKDETPPIADGTTSAATPAASAVPTTTTTTTSTPPTTLGVTGTSDRITTDDDGERPRP